MRLKIRNFGPIEAADLDLNKDFILIVGQNNIGKSYAISLVYAIVKSFNHFRRESYFYYDDDFGERPAAEVKALAASVKERLANSTQDVDITEDLVKLFRSQVAARDIRLLQQTLEGTFNDIANLQNRRTADPLSICLADGKFLLELGIEDARLIVKDLQLPSRVFVARKVKQNRTTKLGEHTVLYFPEDNQRHFEGSVNVLLRRLSGELVTSVCGSIFDLHYLPASRSGLYQSLSAFGQIVAELSKSRTALRQKIELPGISEPLSDYYLKLSDIRSMSVDASNEVFHRAAQEIESEILQGTVEFESKTRRLLFRPDGIDLSLDLSATSSMVSEISPIASYLKYVLPRSQTRISRRDGGPLTQLLILEEPEAHLHPAIQVKLIEILARLATQAKTKILITSHSNYIFNKCSNLIIGGKLERSQVEAILFESGAAGSITKELDVNEFGIQDENFGRTGEDLFEERRELISGLKSV